MKKSISKKIIYLLPITLLTLWLVIDLALPSYQASQWEAALTKADSWQKQKGVLAEILSSGREDDPVIQIITDHLSKCPADAYLKGLLLLQENQFNPKDLFKKQVAGRLWGMAMTDIVKQLGGTRAGLWHSFDGIEKLVLAEMGDDQLNQYVFDAFVAYLKKTQRWRWDVVGDRIWSRDLKQQLTGHASQKLSATWMLLEIRDVSALPLYQPCLEKLRTAAQAKVQMAGLITILDLIAIHGHRAILLEELGKYAQLHSEKTTPRHGQAAISQVAKIAMDFILQIEAGQSQKKNLARAKQQPVANPSIANLRASLGSADHLSRVIACALLVKTLADQPKQLKQLVRQLLISLDHSKRESGLLIAGLSRVKARARKSQSGQTVELLPYLKAYVPWKMKQRVRLALWMQSRDPKFTRQIPLLIDSQAIDLPTLILSATARNRYDLIDKLWQGRRLASPDLIHILANVYRPEIFSVSNPPLLMPRFVPQLNGANKRKEIQRSQIEIAVWLRLKLYRQGTQRSP